MASLLTKRFNINISNVPTNELQIEADDIDDELVDENRVSGNEVSNREWHYIVNGDILLQIVEISTDITDSDKNNSVNRNDLNVTINNRHYRTGYMLVIPDLRIKIPIVPDFNGRFLNPLYSPELAQYFSRQWWSCVVLWNNLIRRIAKRERRTTATIEVYHKILKTMDISKRSLPLDQYLYARAAVI